MLTLRPVLNERRHENDHLTMFGHFRVKSIRNHFIKLSKCVGINLQSPDSIQAINYENCRKRLKLALRIIRFFDGSAFSLFLSLYLSLSLLFFFFNFSLSLFLSLSLSRSLGHLLTLPLFWIIG